MIRLAVYSEAEIWPAVASQLHGASIVRVLAGGDQLPPPDDVDALILAGEILDSSAVEKALARGQHVLCTAGSWMTGENIASLTAIASKSSVQVAIANPDRHLPSRELIRQQLDAGKLGDPGLIRSHRWEPLDQTLAQPGKALPGALVRDIDLAIWYAGKPANVIYAAETAGDGNAARLGRTIQVHLGFAGGAMALLDYSNTLPAGDAYRSLSIIGSAGAAYADDHQNVQLLYQGQQPRAVRVDETVRQWANLTQAFAVAVGKGHGLSPAISNLQDLMTVVPAVEDSLRSRRAVSREGR